MSNRKDTMGDRMKRYEASAKSLLTPNMPVAIRVDGRAFHTWTRSLPPEEGAFSQFMMSAMDRTALDLANEVDGFLIGYAQSDEITIIIDDSRRIETQGWFGYDHDKIISIASSCTTAFFNSIIRRLTSCEMPPAFFDARAFNIPHREVLNCILWRMKDWERNSLQMYARTFFSHKELHGKNRADIHEMLYQIGRNWAADLTGREKNGTLLLPRIQEQRQRIITDSNLTASYEQLSKHAFTNRELRDFYL